MSRISLSELKFETSMEDLFWKQKTWKGLEDIDDVKQLKEAIRLLLELVCQKQSIIKSLVQYQIKQDLQDLHESHLEYKNLPDTPIENGPHDEAHSMDAVSSASSDDEDQNDSSAP